MRTIIQISEKDAAALAEVCKRDGISRSEAVRRAIASFLKQNQPAQQSFSDFFGLWKGRDLDGLKYQETLRKEWKKK